MANDRDTLLSMGFDPARVDWALRATNHRGLQPAMDHLLEYEGQLVPDANAAPPTGAGAGAGSRDQPMDVDVDVDVDDEDEDAEALRGLVRQQQGGVGGDVGEAEAKSIKCSLCGKTFKNTALANYHAEKSGHDQFEESTEEIKPLTEEEKKQKLAELRTKMAAKRAVKAQAEVKEAKANEAIRRKQGKDMNKIKEDLKAKEIAKEAEQKRRDKIEDAKAKAAIKAQIEADKKARAEKAAREKAVREGRPVVDVAGAASPVAAMTSTSTSTSTSASTSTSTSVSTPGTGAVGVAGKDFKDTRLQIRMASGGAPYTTTLPSEATLRDVAEFVAAQTLSVNADTVSFTQQFPRKTFSSSDLGKTLRELGLTPSAVLIAS